MSHVAATDSTDNTTLAVTRKPRATEAQAGVRPPMMTKQMLWHLRLGHQSVATLRELQKKDLVHGLQLGHKDEQNCVSCMRGKATAQPYAKRSGKRNTEVLEMLHLDLWGPSSVASHEGFLHVLTCVDDMSGITVVVGLESPAAAYEAFFDNVMEKRFPRFLQMAKKAGRPHSKAKVQVLQVDYDSVFASERFREMCEYKDVILQFACPYSHGQNGVVERKQRTIASMSISQLVYAKLPLEFWYKSMR